MIVRGDEGLNLNYAREGCIWGKAIYFAVNALYSCGLNHSIGYRHTLYQGGTLSDGSTVPKGTNMVIFAKV